VKVVDLVEMETTELPETQEPLEPKEIVE